MPQRNQGKGSEDVAFGAAKIGLISAIIAAVIAGTATVLAAVVGTNRKGTSANPPVATAGQQTETAMPLPTCASCNSGRTFPEQASTGGAATFRNPRALLGKSNRVDPFQPVEVVCRFYDPNAVASVQPGWWYLLASSPWNWQYYSPANSYLNGDPPEGPHVTPIDGGVPVC